MTVRVLIAENYAVVRQGLRMFLGLDEDIEVVGETADGREAVRLARELCPDVVLMDLLMPVMDGITATAAIRRDLPDVEVVALSNVFDDAMVVGAVRAGAIGFLLEDTESDELRRAVKAAAAGQVQVSPAATAHLVDQVKATNGPDRLTEREIEVLVLLAYGKANKEIARELRVGQQTVKTHVSSILSKLGAHTRTQAAVYAVQRGLVSRGGELNGSDPDLWRTPAGLSRETPRIEDVAPRRDRYTLGRRASAGGPAGSRVATPSE